MNKLYPDESMTFDTSSRALMATGKVNIFQQCAVCMRDRDLDGALKGRLIQGGTKRTDRNGE